MNEPTLEVWIERLTTKGGNAIPLPPRGITVFVGPNNSGKSAALRDIQQHLLRPPHGVVPEWIIVNTIQVEKQSGPDILERWLANNATRIVQGATALFRRTTGQVAEPLVVGYWTQGPPFSELGQLLTLYLPAGAGQGYVGPTQSFNVRDEAPSHPVQALYSRTSLELRVREISRRAFRTQVVVNRFGGNQILLHVGAPPKFEGEPGLPTRGYLDELFALPGLHAQGDGMKSFMGVMISVVAAEYPFILIDEPEAFLHPPQARLLGRLINEYRPAASQVFLSTHDSNILRGLLDARDSQVTVIRLTRQAAGGEAAQLDPDSIRRLWSDPLLRYSNILEGLFHRAVVLCESDADCRYYGSILDTLNIDESTEILFTHCGGKHRMPMVIRALKAVRVPVEVIADFDLLREEQPLHDLVVENGGDWNELEGPWRVLKAALDAEHGRPTRHYVIERANQVLKESTNALVEDREVDAIRHLLRGEGGWDKVKRSGVGGVPQGQPMQAARAVLERLSQLGISVVPIGELERWVPSVGGHGPDWVADVHTHRLHETVESDPARDFLRPIALRALA